MILLKELTSSRTFDENEKANCRSDSTAQYNDAAADKWRKEKRKEWENNKCRREVNEERENERNCEKEILEREREFRYNDVRNRQREELECKNFHEVSHRWHDDDLEQLHKKKNSKKNKNESFEKTKKKKQISKFLSFVWRFYK